MYRCTILAFLVFLPNCFAEPPKPAPRRLLYPAALETVPEALRSDVAKLLDPQTQAVVPINAKACGVYARVLSRSQVLDEANSLRGVLATRPFVFLTVPEALYKRSLVDVFSSIGYDAKDVLAAAKSEQEKVVVLFRYGAAVRLNEGAAFPADWPSAVYPATWDNLFGLAEGMAADPVRHYVAGAGPDDFSKLKVQCDREAAFVASFPKAGRDRIKATPYTVLSHAGGADWEYRNFLQRTFGAAEHFVGSGRTKLTLAEGDTTGFPEFLGPNRELKSLPEIAVIGLGTLRVNEDAPAK